MSISRNHRPGKGQAGLSLIELLVSMIIMGIITTMLVAGWISLQRGSAFAVTSNNARGTARDAISRVASELRGAQPTALPTPTGTATATPAPQPPITYARPNDVQFYSAYNSAAAADDGTGVAAVRLTRMYLDTSTRILWLQRDTNDNDSVAVTDTGDQRILLARNVVNQIIGPDPTNGGSAYTPLFRYAYRANASSPVQWTDNTAGTLALATIVAIRARVIIDANIAHAPKYIDATTTVRLRNASGS